jgi:serine/threonine-protein kinase BUR1
VALKKVLFRAEQEGFPITALREVKLMKRVKHANVIEVLGIAVTSGILID